MKFVIIENQFVTEDLTDFYETVESARFENPFKFVIEAPDYVFSGWIYDGTRVGDACFIKPNAPNGWEYDDETGTFYKITNPSHLSKEKIHSDNIKFFVKLSELSNSYQTAMTQINKLKGVINDDN